MWSWKSEAWVHSWLCHLVVVSPGFLLVLSVSLGSGSFLSGEGWTRSGWQKVSIQNATCSLWVEADEGAGWGFWGCDQAEGKKGQLGWWGPTGEGMKGKNGYRHLSSLGCHLQCLIVLWIYNHEGPGFGRNWSLEGTQGVLCSSVFYVKSFFS